VNDAEEYADLGDVVDIESLDVELGGRVFYAWLRLRDGRGALWEFDLRAPPHQKQPLRIIAGA
jgi:hypothetical protein